MTNDELPALSRGEFGSLRELSNGNSQAEIPHAHGERLVQLGYVLRRLGRLSLTSSGIRRLAAGK
jgi:hypothetical protein